MLKGFASSRRIRAIGILCRIPFAFSMLFPGAIPVLQGPDTEEAFWERLTDTRSLVAGVGEIPEKACPLLAEEADAWSAVQSVRLDSGAVMPVHPDWLVAGLRECPPDFDMLLSRMDALLAARGGTTGNAPPFSADSLRDILSAEEFQKDPGRAERSDPLQEWITSVLKRLAEIGRQVNLPKELQWAAGIAASGLLLGILLLAFRTFRRNWVKNVDPDSAGDLPPGALNADRAAALARGKWASGDKRPAVRYLYLSILLHLEESGRISGNRSLTNQEYLRSLAHLPALAVPFRKAAGVFERVWYGFHSPSDTEFREYLETAAEIRRVS